MLKNKNSKAYQETWNEIDILSALDHENVIKVYEIVDTLQQDDKSEFFVALEYCEKGQLMDYYEETKQFEPKVANNKSQEYFKEDEIRYFSRQIVQGLDYIHSQGILHCDLKPLNILIDENNIAKLADFGVSQIFRGKNDMLTRSKGTFEFLAPEILSSKPEPVSGKALDVWAFGLILYCMAFNDLPFAIGGGVIKNIQNFVLDFEGKRPISEPLKTLITGLLQKDPYRRYTIQDIYNDPWFNNFDASQRMTSLSSTIASKPKRNQLPQIVNHKKYVENLQKQPSLVNDNDSDRNNLNFNHIEGQNNRNRSSSNKVQKSQFHDKESSRPLDHQENQNSQFSPPRSKQQNNQQYNSSNPPSNKKQNPIDSQQMLVGDDTASKFFAAATTNTSNFNINSRPSSSQMQQFTAIQPRFTENNYNDGKNQDQQDGMKKGDYQKQKSNKKKEEKDLDDFLFD
eukprot:403349840